VFSVNFECPSSNFDASFTQSYHSILDKNETTNEKLETIASSINVIKEFVIAEAEYVRIKKSTDSIVFS
jgi:hypothetical protein|tara:strand:+ start:314 stop:520 length:207 start_codon:yes stop_codon:yes gene_type:complete